MKNNCEEFPNPKYDYHKDLTEVIRNNIQLPITGIYYILYNKKNWYMYIRKSKKHGFIVVQCLLGSGAWIRLKVEDCEVANVPRHAAPVSINDKKDNK